MLKFSTMNNDFFLHWHLKFSGRSSDPHNNNSTRLIWRHDTDSATASPVLGISCTDDSNLVSWNGAHLVQHSGQTSTKYSETVCNFKRHWSWNLTIILLSQDPPERTSPPWQLEVILEDNVPSLSKVCPQV